MRALLAEPDSGVRSHLHAALNQRGWRVTVVPGGDAAIQAFLASPFPLVVLSSQLTDTDSLAVCRAIRGTTVGRAAYLLVTHPTSAAEAIRPMVEAGADDCLTLPLVPAEVSTRLAFAESRLAVHPGEEEQGEVPTVSYAERVAELEHEIRMQQRSLAESESRYLALFDQSPVGVFLCDMELRVTHCNRSLSSITGMPEEVVVGTRIGGAEAGALPPWLLDAARPAVFKGPYRTGSDGSGRWISVRYVPLRDREERVVGGVGVVEDVTDRERAEERLRAQATELELVNAALHERTRELEAAMQARTRLYTSMNHELRTPISAIMLYQELLLAGALGELTEEQREAVANSHTAAEHLLELVRDILDLSKIEAGKMEVNPVEVELPALVRDLLATVHPLTQRYGSEIRLESPDGLPRLVTDPQRVRQVLLNLISNAARFGRARPITIRCRRLSESETAVEVEDQGIGIGEADLQEIFEEFVQVGKIQEGGTGLGLAISRRLARLLDGRLEVESEPEVGSVFRLILPSATPSIPVPQEQK
jgi:PAS domain S-box-containing protein